MDGLKSLISRHSNYFNFVWSVSMVIGYIYAILNLIGLLFETAAEGNLLGFLFLVIFNSIIMILNGIIAAVGIFVTLVIITIIPYLIFRGLTK